MHRREYILASGAVLGASSIGAVAFTSANLSRDITIDVAADDLAVIGLSGGVSGISVNSNGLLNIAPPSSASADGLNPEGTFTYGDSTDPTNIYGFQLTNNDSQAHDYTIGINTTRVEIDIYDSGGASVGTVTDTNDVTVTGLGSGSSVYAHLRIDTTGLTSADSISGTMTISAT